MEQQTWVTLAALASFALGLFTYLAAMRREFRGELRAEISGVRGEIGGVRGEIAALRTELKGDIAESRAELKGDIAGLKTDISRLDGRLVTIEQRTYDLASRLPHPAG